MQTTIKRGDVYYCDLKAWPDSDVQSGRRPVVVISNNIGNFYSNVVTVAPVTSRIKDFPTHYTFFCGNTESQILLEQIVTVPKDSLFSFKMRLSDTQLEEINEYILTALGIIPTHVSNAAERVKNAQQAKEDIKQIKDIMPQAEEIMYKLAKMLGRWQNIDEAKVFAKGKIPVPEKKVEEPVIAPKRKVARSGKKRDEEEVTRILEDYEKLPAKEVAEKYGYSGIPALRSSVFYFRKLRRAQ